MRTIIILLVVSGVLLPACSSSSFFSNSAIGHYQLSTICQFYLIFELHKVKPHP
jgi:hypothetical protein